MPEHEIIRLEDVSEQQGEPKGTLAEAECSCGTIYLNATLSDACMEWAEHKIVSDITKDQRNAKV